MFLSVAAIVTAGNAIMGNAFTNNQLVFCLPSFTLPLRPFTWPLLKALPSRHDDDENSTRLIKLHRKLERSSADSRSFNTTANPAYDSSNYLPLPTPAHNFYVNDDLQSRLKAYRSKCHSQVVDEGVGMDRTFYREFAEYVNSVWLHKDLARKYYQKAITQMKMDPSWSSKAGGLMAEYAEFVWKALEDIEEANQVFENAVRDYPEDVELLGSYASFLWELSENDE